MAVLPFRWQGRRRSEQVCAHVTSRSEQWISDWSGRRDLKILVSITPPEHRDGARPDQWYALHAKQGMLYANVRASTFEHLGCLLIGSSDGDDLGLAEGIGRRALMDLVRALGSDTRDDQIARLDLPPGRDLIGPTQGIVRLLWAISGFEMDIYMDAAMCDAWVPTSFENTPSLTPLHVAILPGKIDLNIVLDLGMTSIEDAFTLRPGEVIRTAVPVDSVVHAKVGDGDHSVFTARLVADGGYRAVQCLGVQA